MYALFLVFTGIGMLLLILGFIATAVYLILGFLDNIDVIRDGYDTIMTAIENSAGAYFILLGFVAVIWLASLIIASCNVLQ